MYSIMYVILVYLMDYKQDHQLPLVDHGKSFSS